MSGRDLTAGVLAQIASGTIRPIMLYEGEFNTGTLRMWSGTGTLRWNSLNWTGAGTLLSVSPIEEIARVQAPGMEITLSGISSEVLSAVLSAARINKVGKIYLGFFDTDNSTIIADPVTSFQGKLDQPYIEEDGRTCSISVRYENRIADMKRPKERRYTSEDQKVAYPSDLGFEYVNDLQEREVVWGGSKNYIIQSPLGKLNIQAANDRRDEIRSNTSGNGTGTVYNPPSTTGNGTGTTGGFSGIGAGRRNTGQVR